MAIEDGKPSNRTVRERSKTSGSDAVSQLIQGEHPIDFDWLSSSPEPEKKEGQDWTMWANAYRMCS